MSSKKNLVGVALVFTACYSLLTAFNGAERNNEEVFTPRTTEKAIVNEMPPATKTSPSEEPKGCVFKTVFGEENADSMFVYKTPAKVSFALGEALEWMAKAQLNNGGFGAGTHSNQGVLNPHAVQADPATTAMVAMAILRSGSTLTKGTYSGNLSRALEFLLDQVEESENNEFNITNLTGTQPQVKLGQNIDVVLTSQFFTNILDYLQNNIALKNRVVKCNNKCLVKIQQAMAENGSIRGAGWAGVLQSSFATNALETARDKGLKVDDEKLEQAKNYQKGNFDVSTNTAETEDGAGVMLYSLSSTARSSAKEAGEAKDYVAKAKREGKIAESAPVSIEALKKSGMSDSEALRYGTAYEINQAASKQVQREDVMEGFGSNGVKSF
ncbi:hypothetical protein BH11BAC1_BH11BAC1_18710 [soil metagenome]